VRFVFTGPESVGKSTFCLEAQRKWGGGLVSEIARNFLIDIGVNYTFEDVTKIGIKQMEEENAISSGYSFVWCDTDLITVMIWSLDKFGKVDESLYAAWSLVDLTNRIYFLCFPDIPWEEDPLRENPYDRDRIVDLYRNFLDHYKLRYTILRGNTEDKWKMIEDVFVKKSV
jgi:nicotinamide riboside kinase